VPWQIFPLIVQAHDTGCDTDNLTPVLGWRFTAGDFSS